MSKNKFDLRHKETLTLFLEEFFQLFFPEIAPKINFKTVTFIDKELSALFSDPETHNDQEGRTDALIAVETFPMADGTVVIFLIHWEQSGDKHKAFNERMYHYGCGIYYKFRKPVFPIAIFTDRAKWKIRVPEIFEMTLFGKAIATYGYNQIKLKDYRAEYFEKKIDENPLAAAYLPLTDYPADRRPEIKAKAVKGIAKNVEKGKKQATLFSLIDVSLALNPDEEKQYKDLIQNHPDYKEVKMLESIEQVGIEKGIERGIEKGIEQGKKGGKSSLILKLLNKRFGSYPPTLDRILSQSEADVLDKFGEAIFDFENLEDAEKWWNNLENIGNA